MSQPPGLQRANLTRQMRRREFITFMGSAVAWPLAAHAQQARVYRVGALFVGNADAETFRRELGEELPGRLVSQSLAHSLCAPTR